MAWAESEIKTSERTRAAVDHTSVVHSLLQCNTGLNKCKHVHYGFGHHYKWLSL